MSFILDALKKSESDRQEQADTEFATVPSSSAASVAPRWLWVLGSLLIINIIVLFGLILRPDAPEINDAATNQAAVGAAVGGPLGPTATIAAVETAPSSATPTSESASFADQVAVARQNQPARTRPVPQPVTAANITPAVSVKNLPQTSVAILPSLTELRANGTLQLPDLHVDIHVYSDVQSERFVFINMNKYKENSSLDEGPVLKEITSDGVILEHNGIAFILPRE
jgi:general secretion pathway protein B